MSSPRGVLNSSGPACSAPVLIKIHVSFLAKDHHFLRQEESLACIPFKHRRADFKS